VKRLTRLKKREGTRGARIETGHMLVSTKGEMVNSTVSSEMKDLTERNESCGRGPHASSRIKKATRGRKGEKENQER